MHIAILVIYFFALTCILLFSLFQLQLAYYYLQGRRKRNTHPGKPEMPAQYPFVTIQLPIYNERYVVERLLEKISGINYPKDKFEIQILDDSTDETSDIIRNKIEELADKRLNISYINRPDRLGFKAGALREGLKTSQGELVAIFDADFLPDSDFLLNTIPYFSDEGICAVQTRWGHLNKDYSLLTQLQAFALDVHFTIEQGGRDSTGYFIGFNGTSGVWRKTAIIDAGNWEGDTLTEDLDLSYRAQLKGWKLKYLESVVTPGELPVDLNAIKVQQFRWMKGGVQNFLKNSKKVLKAPIPFMTKVNGLFHLLNGTVFIFSFLVSMLSYPVMLIQKDHSEFIPLFSAGSVFILPTLILLFYYGIAYFTINHSFKSVLLFPVYFWLFLVFILGLSMNNVVAVGEAFLGIKSSFLRTPKFNIRSKSDSWMKNKYLTEGVNYITVLEIIIALFFLYCIIASVEMKYFSLLYFHVMLFIGFGAVSFLSLKKFVVCKMKLTRARAHKRI
ncbi:MAG: glycosyltransferase family 2 protein [Bacteroidales bacterium]|nr:glycosyltransferase family 2 protein [Bacteroidales bacterium]